MATVDSLDIVISASMEKANQALNTAVKSLGLLAEGISAITKNSGLEEYSKRAREFSAKFSDIGKQVTESMKSISDASENVAQKANEMGKSVSESMKPIQEQAKKVSKSIEQIVSELNTKTMNLTPKLNMNNLATETKKYENQLRNAQNQLDKILAMPSAKKQERTIERLVANINEAKNALKQIENIGINIKTKGTENAKESIEKLKEDIQKTIQDVEKTGGYKTNVGNLTEEQYEIFKKLNLEAIFAKNNVEETTEEIKKVSEEMQNIGKVAGIEDVSKNISESIKTATGEIGDFSNALNQVGEKVPKVDINTDNIKSKIEEIRDSFGDIGNNINFSGGLEDIKNKIASAAKELEGLEEKESKIISAKTIDMTALRDTEGTIARLQNEIGILEDLKERTQEFREQLKQLQIPPIRENNLAKLQSDLEKSKRKIISLKTELQNKIITGKITANIDDSGYRKLREQIALTGKTIDALQLKIQEVSEKTKLSSTEMADKFRNSLKNLQVPPIREDNLKKLQSSLEKTEARLEELRAKLANGLEMGRITESVDDKNYVKLQEQIALTEKQAEALRAKIQEVEQQSKTNWAESLSNALGKVTSFAKQAHTALSKISVTLSKLNSGISKAFSKFASLGKALTSVSKSSKSSELSLSKAFKMVLRYGLGIRSVYTLINKLRRAIVEGFKNLAQYSDEVNASISMLKGSFETLKNSSAAALSPLLNAIAPALNAIIQLCIRAANAINQFLSAIFGKGYWIKAKDQVVDYADSIKKAGKEAKNGIRQFDELKLISTDGGGSGTDTNVGDMFETLPIEDRFKEAAEKTKKILEDLFRPLKAAWDSEGKFVMDSWKYALDEIKKLAKDIGRDFLTVWNQPETIAMFEDIFHIVGDIGLVIGNLAKNFREAWNTNQVGLHIFENIRDILAVIIHNIRLAADYTVEWSKTLDFYPLLSKIEEWTKSLIPVFDSLSGIITDFYTQVLLPLAKWTLEQGLPDLLQVFIDFNSKVDWEALRANLSEFWQHLEPFAETVGEGLIIFIERVSDAIANFLNSETFVNFLHDIENWMDNVTPEDVANGIEKLVKALIAFKVAVIGINALKGVSAIINAISMAIGKLISIGSTLFAFGRNIVGVFELMSNAGMTLHSSMTTIFGGLGTTLAGVFSVVSGIVLAVKNFVTMLTDGFSWLNEILMVVGTALAAIGAVILGAPALVAGIVAAVVAAIATIVVVIHDNWDAICEWLSGVADWINTNVIQPVIGFFQGVWTSVSGFFSNLWNDITGIWSAASGWFNSAVIEPVVNFFQGLSLRVQQIFEGLWIIIQAVWIIVSQWFNENVIIPIVGFFQGLWENVSGFFASLWEDIVAIWTTVSEWFDMNVIAPVTDFFRQLWEDVSGFFSDLWDSIVDIWIGAANWFDSTVIQPLLGFFNALWSGIRQGIVDAMNAAIGAIEGGINFIVNGINSVLSGFNDLVSAAASLVGASWGGVNLVPTVSLPRLATGGIVYEATFAEIGEAGKEGILPLTNHAAMSQLVGEIMASAGGSQYGNGYDDGYSEELSLLMSQNQLLREQNRLLQAILDKPTIDNGTITRSAINGINETTRRTGKTPILLY